MGNDLSHATFTGTLLGDIDVQPKGDFDIGRADLRVERSTAKGAQDIEVRLVWFGKKGAEAARECHRGDYVLVEGQFWSSTFKGTAQLDLRVNTIKRLVSVDNSGGLVSPTEAPPPEPPSEQPPF